MLIAPEEVWNNCLDIISEKVSSHSFEAWIRPILPVSLNQSGSDAKFGISLPNRFAYDWLRSHYEDVLVDTLEFVLGTPVSIDFSIDPKQRDVAPELPFPEINRHDRPAVRKRDILRRPAGKTNSAAEPKKNGSKAKTPQFVNGGIANLSENQTVASAYAAMKRPDDHPDVNNFNTDYTFDNFVKGDCNMFARGAALAIAKSPGGTNFNPFFVYGAVGLGKTHLALAIGHEAIKNNSEYRALYVTSDQFTTEFVTAVKSADVGHFVSQYADVDLLIVDDIQFFGGKEKTQDEFYHIFNELSQRGKQIILCADRPPEEIKGIKERLLSRFRSGLVADVQAPDLETRTAILLNKVAEHGLYLDRSVVDYVAENIRNNVRTLEGALNRFVAYSKLLGRPIDLELSRDLLKDMVDSAPRFVRIDDCIAVAASYYKLDTDQLRGKTRTRHVSKARQVAMSLSRHFTSHSLKAIGLYFGGRDHSTVIHACNAVQDRTDVDPIFSEELLHIRGLVESHIN